LRRKEIRRRKGGILKMEHMGKWKARDRVEKPTEHTVHMELENLQVVIQADLPL